jgi:hypothetical protein
MCDTLPRREGGFGSVLGEIWALRIEVSRWCLGVDYRRSVMVLPQVKGLSAEIWDFSRGLGEIQPLENEVSHWYLGVDCM